MSTASPVPASPAGADGRFVIVASRFNEPYVQGLIDHATAELHRQSAQCSITLYRVPGAFEIPVAVRAIAAKKEADAILAIGVILKGQTDHAENLARSVTDALQRIALEHGVPVINCVLSLGSEEQARARCLEEKINRGREGAQAAIEITRVMAELNAKS